MGQFRRGNGCQSVTGVRSFIQQNQIIDAREAAGTGLA
jgi:hypothetical protein